MKKEIIEEYDITRIIATFLVIIGHCGYYTILTNYGGVDYLGIMKAMNISDTITHKLITYIIWVIYSFHMPLFIALSGALFFNQLSKNKFGTLKELIVNKFYRLILPFFIVTTLYSVPIKLISGYYDFSNISQTLKDIVLGQFLLMGNSHLWYLPSLFISFIMLYLIEKTCKNHSVLKGLGLLLLHFISFKIPFPLISNPLKYTVWFYMGYEFEKRRLKCNEYIKRSNSILISSIAIFIISILTIKLITPSNFILSILQEILNCLCAVCGSFIVYNISYLITIKTKVVSTKFKKEISKNSFGMYLYSDTINYLILFLFLKLFTINIFGSEIGSFTIFLIRLIVTAILSLFISKILKKAKVKYIC